MSIEVVTNAEEPRIHRARPSAERRQQRKLNRGHFYRSVFRQVLGAFYEIRECLGESIGVIDHAGITGGQGAQNCITHTSGGYCLLEYCADVEGTAKKLLSPAEFELFRPLLKRHALNLDVQSEPFMRMSEKMAKAWLSLQLFPLHAYLVPGRGANLTHAGQVSRLRSSRLKDPEWADVGNGRAAD